MKKIIITAVIAVAAVAAQAQSPRVEVSIAETGFKGLSSHAKVSNQKATSLDTLQKKVERQVAKRVEQEQSKKAVQTAQKPSVQREASPKSTTATPKKTCKSGKACCQSKKRAVTKKTDLADQITYPSSLPSKW